MSDPTKAVQAVEDHWALLVDAVEKAYQNLDEAIDNLHSARKAILSGSWCELPISEEHANMLYENEPTDREALMGD